MIAFDLQRRAAVLPRGARIEKCVDLSLEHALLDGGEELLRLRKRQAHMLNASVVVLQGDDIGNGFFVAIIITNNALKFDAHGGASPGSHGR